MSSIERAICLAVLRVCRDFRVTRAGGSLRLEDMESAWRLTGLRALDLRAGISRLQRDGVLQLTAHPVAADNTVALLPAGEARLRSVRGAMWSGLEALGSAIGLRAYARRRGSGALFREIRRGDRSLPPRSGSVESDPEGGGVQIDPIRG